MATTRGSLRRRTHGSGSIYARANQSNVSLADLNCRTPTIGRESFFIKSAAGRESRTVRLARLKPGFVIGTLSSTSQIDICGDHIAITVCRLHHLGQSEINELEKRNPRLILELFKMMVSLRNVLNVCHVHVENILNMIGTRLSFYHLNGFYFYRVIFLHNDKRLRSIN